MTQTMLKLSVHKTKSGFQSILNNEDGSSLGSEDFEYQIDKNTTLKNLKQFDAEKIDAPSRNEKARAFGESLFEQVFSPEMRDNFKLILNNSDSLRLVVGIDENADYLSLIPWEFLHDGDDFLSAHEKIDFCPEEPDSLQTDPTKDSWSYISLRQLGSEFVGRRVELRRIKECFFGLNSQAVVVHGVDGVGKTSLAMQASRLLNKQFQGVYTFDCSDGALTADRIFDELIQLLMLNGFEKLRNMANAPLPSIQKATFLAHILKQAPLLLIFDNMESLLDEEENAIENRDLADFLRTLINGGPSGSKYLFTSRRSFSLPPDPDKDEETETSVIQFINLNDVFLPEAHMIMNKFPSLLNADYKLKSDVYQKLGGHPYTLELFAKYCVNKDPREVLESLDESGGEKSSFSMLEKTVKSLSEPTLTLLKRISVFRQALPPEALTWVMGKEVELDGEMLEAWRKYLLESAKEALREQSIDNNKYEKDKKYLEETSQEDLGKLYQKHFPQEREIRSLKSEVDELTNSGLLDQLTDKENRTRYMIHQSASRLCRKNMDKDEYNAALLEAAAFYMNAAKTFPPDSPEMALSKLDCRRLLLMAGEYEKAGDIVNETHFILARLGFISQSEQLLQKSIESLSGAGQRSAMGKLANLYTERGEYKKAVALYEKLYKIFEESDDPRNMSASSYQLGIIYQRSGDYETALKEYKASLEISEQIDDKNGMAITRHQLGLVKQQLGDYDAALTEYQLSLSLKEQLGDKNGMAITHHHLGMIHHQRGDYDAALAEYQLSLGIKEQIGDQSGIAYTRHQLTILNNDHGNDEAAFAECKAALEIFEQLGDKNGVGITTGQMGRLDEQQGQYETALEKYLKAMVIFQSLGSADSKKAFEDLKRLRNKWGRENFDPKWLKAANEKWPEE